MSPPKVHVSILFGLLLFLFSSLSIAKPTLKIGILEFPPFSYFEENNAVLTGSIVELTRRVFDEAGYKTEFIILPFARSIAAAESGEVDICGMLNAATSEVLQLSKSSVGELRQTFYVRSSNDWAYQNIDSLTGLSVINVSSYNYASISSEYQDFLLNDKNVVNISSSPDYLKRIVAMIENGRADVFNEASDVMEHQLQVLGAKDKIKAAGTLGSPLKLFIGARPNKKGVKILEDFDKAFKTLHSKDQIIIN
ncbi:transporter substrate-binding domain-containing protein [Alteromonadaceae bacterium M269]|nr:transporter substrate-binding domain-containing protein [Alteromonadaceae bacterium M269]